MPNPMSSTSRRFPGKMIGAVMLTILLPGLWSARAQTAAPGHAFEPCVHTAQILELAQYLAATNGAPDAYARVVRAAFDSPPGDASIMKAFEENRSFVYAVAGMQSEEGASSEGRPAATLWVRRLIVLNPSTFIIDDDFPASLSPGGSEACLDSQTAPKVYGSVAHISAASGEITSEILFPMKVNYLAKRTGDGQESERYFLETTVNGPRARILQILQIGKGASAGKPIQSALITATGDWKLNVTADGRVFRLTLPSPTQGAGEISIAYFRGQGAAQQSPLPIGNPAPRAGGKSPAGALGFGLSASSPGALGHRPARR